MKKIVVLLLSLFFSFSIFGQNKKHNYFQFDIAVPLKGNPDRGETDLNGNVNNLWFLPDGLSTKLGYGIQHNKWVSIGIHSGIDWQATNKLVVIPVFANFRLSPNISDGTRIYLQTGYGKSFAIGRGNLSSDYKKLSLGVENSDGVSLFLEFAQYGFALKYPEKIGSISLGISLTSF